MTKSLQRSFIQPTIYSKRKIIRFNETIFNASFEVNLPNYFYLQFKDLIIMPRSDKRWGPPMLIVYQISSVWTSELYLGTLDRSYMIWLFLPLASFHLNKDVLKIFECYQRILLLNLSVSSIPHLNKHKLWTYAYIQWKAIEERLLRQIMKIDKSVM